MKKLIILLLVVFIFTSCCVHIQRYKKEDGQGSMYHLYYPGSTEGALKYIKQQFPNYISVTSDSYDYYIYCNE